MASPEPNTGVGPPAAHTLPDAPQATTGPPDRTDTLLAPDQLSPPRPPRPPDPPGRGGGGGGAAAGGGSQRPDWRRLPARPALRARVRGGAAAARCSWRAGGGERRRGRGGTGPIPAGRSSAQPPPAGLSLLPITAAAPRLPRSPGGLWRCWRPTERCGPASGSRGGAPVPGGAGEPPPRGGRAWQRCPGRARRAAGPPLLSRPVLSLQLEMPARTGAPPSCSGLDLRSALPPRGHRPAPGLPPAPRLGPRPVSARPSGARTHTARLALVRFSPPVVTFPEAVFHVCRHLADIAL